MSGSKPIGASMPSIITRAELVQRLAQRARPLALPRLTIDGSQERDVHSTLDRLNEGRIRQPEEGLRGAGDGLETNHRLALLRGRVKAYFGLCR